MKKFDPKGYIKEITNKFGQIPETVLVAVSGGVDSSVSAAILLKAGLNVRLLFVDTGFLRKNESSEVLSSFNEAKLSVDYLDASSEFYSTLKGKKTSKVKREEFRKIYFKIISEYASEHNISHVAQGTQFHNGIAKTYHNCPTDKFLKLGFKSIEPVKTLKKDEIRMLAKELKLPEEIEKRTPFPGPGLLIRFGGEFTKDKLDIIREATFILENFISRNAKEFKDCYQIFPYLSSDDNVTFVDGEGTGSVGPILLIRAIKVEKNGDDLVYRPCSIRQEVLDGLVEKLMLELPVARVCFDLTSKYGYGEGVKAGGTIEYA